MQRRDFLKTLNQLMLLGFSGSLPGVLISPSISRADDSSPGPKRFFVLIRATGGWDVTLGLDPKVHAGGSDQSDMFIEYRPDEILKSGNILLGPACAPLLPYAADLAVINGVFMSDANVSHPANLDYISTGDSLGLAPDMTVEAAYASDTGPFGLLFNLNLKRANRNLMPTTISNLESLRTSTDITGLSGFLAKLKSRDDFHQSQESLLKNSAARARLLAAMDSVKADIEQPPVSTNIAPFGRASAVVAAAFSSRASFQAQLDLGLQLDTHSGHPGTHLTNQKMIWEAVANLFRLFKKVPATDAQGNTIGSLFDMTTFCVVSEFARTPALNASMGKDHNPLTNSVLLAGAGVSGGSAFGASRLITRRNSATGEPRHCAGLIDYASGAIAQTKSEAQKPNFQFIFPENVVSTLAEILQVDRSRFASVRRDTPSIPSLIKGGR